MADNLIYDSGQAEFPVLSSRLLHIQEMEKPVLDKGFVRLVDWMGDDDSVVRAARVSYGAGTKGVREDEALIHYMMRHRHTSPFEHVMFTFHVKAPLFVVAQWERHRTWSFNEESLRYSEFSGDMYVPEQFRGQSASNKQGSEGVVDNEVCWGAVAEANGYSMQAYDLMTYFGVAREMARMVLPQNIYKSFYATVDLHNLLHFLSLRLDEHAQWEIRQYAEALAYFAKAVAPVSYKAWEDYVLNAVTLSAGEIRQLQRLLNGLDIEDGVFSKGEHREFEDKLRVEIKP